MISPILCSSTQKKTPPMFNGAYSQENVHSLMAQSYLGLPLMELLFSQRMAWVAGVVATVMLLKLGLLTQMVDSLRCVPMECSSLLDQLSQLRCALWEGWGSGPARGVLRMSWEWIQVAAMPPVSCASTCHFPGPLRFSPAIFTSTYLSRHIRDHGVVE